MKKFIVIVCLFIGASLVIFGSFAAILRISHLIEKRAIKSDEKRVIGQVLDKNQHLQAQGNQRAGVWYVRYVFKDRNGNSYTMRDKIDQNAYNLLSEDDYVEIFYNTYNPYTSRIIAVSRVTLDQIITVFITGILLLVFGLYSYGQPQD
ncbi:MAG: DUF3592 domain-containing protein [Candidatus Omnitrophica bacterium]|nr:DUF3592 domain-containing protein [Candidatus Omnitrophota bacterium]